MFDGRRRRKKIPNLDPFLVNFKVIKSELTGNSIRPFLMSEKKLSLG